MSTATFHLPGHGRDAIPLPHFPTRHQAFLFRAYEYIPVFRLAAFLQIPEAAVRAAAEEMGLTRECPNMVWLEKGYITIIRRMWHLLPYEQLLQLLDMEEQTLALLLKEEDFLGYKLSDKPVCEPVRWRELTEAEKQQTAEIRKIMESLSTEGREPFDFSYDPGTIRFLGKPVFDLRMVYPFSGLYQHAFDVDSNLYCPDEMLEAYRNVGINAVWTQGVLFQLTEFPFAPALSEGHEKRLERLRIFTQRCARYGIKVMLYLNEPRCMPEDFYLQYPHLKGHTAGRDQICLCTSTQEVQDYLRNSVETICRKVPLIGGFFTITRSENLTNCYSHSSRDTCSCPRCQSRPESEVIAEVIRCIEEGAHKVNPEIKVIAWSWRWDECNLEIIEKLPASCILMSQSELDIPYEISGVSGRVLDYSMSIIGPGDRAKAEWKAARKRGLRTAAKVQINTTWEGSTIPALPVYPLIEKHMEGLKAEGVSDLLLSWTLGGYPSQNILHAAKYFYEACETKADTPGQQKAAALFSEAFREFPFHIDVLYHGPQNAGPSTLLFDSPTGYRATMTCFAYDDLDRWRANYPREVLREQFAKLCSKWKEGLDVLAHEPEDQMKIMAHGAYCLFRSSLNQICFYIARDQEDTPSMIAAATDEITVATQMLKLMNREPAIGFEAANHYYFSKGCLCEKVLNCRDIIHRLNNK